MAKNLVVGAGLSGAVIANLIADNADESVLVVDKKSHIAGNCYDFRDKNGIMIHKYGPHIFHTNSEIVWYYLNKFTRFNTYMHEVYGNIDGIETHIPFNFNTLYDVFPQSLANKLEQKLLAKFKYNEKVPIYQFLNQYDEDLKFLANYVYEKIFLHYTTKQWGINPKDLDSSVLSRVPVYLSKDNRYFQDKYQGIPIEGYTKTVENMLNHKNIKLKLSTDYNDIDISNFDKIFYTGSIDEFYNYEFGELPYRSVYFKFEEYDKPYYQSHPIINYPCNYDFTRIHEYKYLLDDKSDKTVIAKEYSEPFVIGKNDRYYPIPGNLNLELYNKYLQKAEGSNVYFLGRLGDYKYYNMDQAVLRAIELFDIVFKSGINHG